MTGVVARYEWRDEDDIDREAYDAAGTQTNVAVFDFPGGYPGPGAAAAILARRAGSGRTQTVTAITNMAATPGMSASIDLPGAPETLGRITSVSFDLAEGYMEVGTAGLIDIPPGSWLDWNATQRWMDVNPLLEWEDA